MEGDKGVPYREIHREATPYYPSVKDVLEVKELLFKFDLPVELLDAVIDFAEYWPHTTSVTSHNPESPVMIRAGAAHENKFLLRSWPLGTESSEAGLVDNTIGYAVKQATATPPQPRSAYDKIPSTEGSRTKHLKAAEPQDAESQPAESLTQDKGVESSEAGLVDNTLEHALRQAITASPQAWPTSRNIPGDATKEILDKWAAESLPRGEFPCRKIVFTIKSHDQGWGGSFEDRGTYKGSFTWFDVGLEKFSAFRDDPALEAVDSGFRPQLTIPTDTEPLAGYFRTVLPRTIPNPRDTSIIEFEHALIPSRECLQKNKAAEKTTTEHIITWSSDDNIMPDSVDGTALESRGRGRDTATGAFVRSLKIGDVVTVWGKSRFPGWVNVVESVKVDVYWAV